jgi:flagellar FliL protein
MLKNKMLQWLIMILIAITLIALASFVLWDYLDKRSNPAGITGNSTESVQTKRLSAKQIKDQTVEIKDVVTNLMGNDYIKISFAFELENSGAKEEFELLQTRVKSIIVQTLVDLTTEQIRGSKGLDLISTTLINKINPILTKGKLTRVDITDISIDIN